MRHPSTIWQRKNNSVSWRLFLFLASLLAAMGIFIVPAFSSAAVSDITSGLRVGSSGTGVTALQEYLASDTSIYPEGQVTGYFGPLTESAVKRFQCRQNIVCNGDAASTGYGRIGPRTLAAIQGTSLGNNGTTTGGIFGDLNAPIMSAATIVNSLGVNVATTTGGTLTATTTSGTATTTSGTATTTPGTINTTSGFVTMNWTTNEPARSRVMYGLFFPFLYASAPSFSDSTLDTTTSISLSGLTRGVTYYYVRESIDAAGNVMWTVPQTFIAP